MDKHKQNEININTSSKQIEEKKLTNEELTNISKLIMKTNINNFSSNIINDNIYEDLEIFKSNDIDHPPIYDKINYTNTYIGTEYLKNILLNPTDNLEFLENRKRNIKKITMIINLLHFYLINLKL